MLPAFLNRRRRRGRAHLRLIARDQRDGMAFGDEGLGLRRSDAGASAHNDDRSVITHGWSPRRSGGLLVGFEFPERQIRRADDAGQDVDCDRVAQAVRLANPVSGFTGESGQSVGQSGNVRVAIGDRKRIKGQMRALGRKLDRPLGRQLLKRP